MNDDNTIISEKLYSLLIHCSHALSRGHHPHNGMHPGQWRILSILAANGAMTQKDLLDVVQIRAASLSELLSKLEAKGFVTRIKDEDDKRSISIEVTELGKKAINENESYQQETVSELFSLLTVSEQEQLVELLEKLVRSWHDKYHGGGYGMHYENGRGCHHQDERHCHHHGHHFH